ncbi:MAG: universal stress protein [Halobacteriaceae archaeon]
MYRALVPLDADLDRAEAQARAVRRLPGTGDELDVTLLHVGDDREADVPAVDRAESVLSEVGADVTRMVRQGDPASVIVNVASEVDAEAIVLGGRKRSPLGSFLFGSVSQAVMADASRPVMITGTEVKHDPTHVCQSCGETYHLEEGVEVSECRACGGTKVEART